MERYMTATETAKEIRKVLKAEFPQQKFSVRKSNGGSVRVGWRDGVSMRDVEMVIRRFSGSSFDAMRDMQVSKGAFLYEGEWVHSGVDYIFYDRAYSEDAVLRTAQAIADDYGLQDLPNIYAVIGETYYSENGTFDDYFTDKLRRTLQVSSF